MRNFELEIGCKCYTRRLARWLPMSNTFIIQRWRAVGFATNWRLNRQLPGVSGHNQSTVCALNNLATNQTNGVLRGGLLAWLE